MQKINSKIYSLGTARNGDSSHIEVIDSEYE